MELNVEIISKETINPSSPTPHHLRIFKLSLLDQQIPSAHVPIILYYSANDDGKVQTENQFDRLKISLSEILTQFYMLAGRINDNYSIDCNDEGVNFFEARVNGNLSQVLNNPIPDELHKLLPTSNDFYGLRPKVLLCVKLNIFECRGVALGVCILHKVVDALSLSLFLKSWAALARGNNEVLKPKLGLTSLLLPPKSNIPAYVPPSESSIEKLVTKRFVFNPSSISSLRAKCSNNLYVEEPTRVEAVLALLWSCAMRIREDDIKVSTLVVSTNLGGRMVPTLSDVVFGNVVGTTVVASVEESSRELHCLVGKLREAIRKIDNEYVKKLQAGDDGSSTDQAPQQNAMADVELYIFTSWCRLSFYEADFGWGKPVWTSSNNFNDKNMALLMDTKCGNGIEAWITLNEEDMARFKCDAELIYFTYLIGQVYFSFFSLRFKQLIINKICL